MTKLLLMVLLVLVAKVAAQCSYTCTSDLLGRVVGFDQTPAVMDGKGKHVFFKTATDNEDPCKISVIAVRNNHKVKWLSVNVGVHPNSEKYKASFAFNRHGNGVVQQRGHGWSEAEDVDLSTPYTWSHGETAVTITKFEHGWGLEGLGDCQYWVYFDPDALDGTVVGTLTADDPPETVGACGPDVPQ